jgi:valyl-tRNA synthetase
VYEVEADVLAEVRKMKSTQKVSLAAPVARVHVVDTPERLAALEAARNDVCDAGKIGVLECTPGSPAAVQVELAPVTES